MSHTELSHSVQMVLCLYWFRNSNVFSTEHQRHRVQDEEWDQTEAVHPGPWHTGNFKQDIPTLHPTSDLLTWIFLSCAVETRFLRDWTGREAVWGEVWQKSPGELQRPLLQSAKLRGRERRRTYDQRKACDFSEQQKAGEAETTSLADRTVPEEVVIWDVGGRSVEGSLMSCCSPQLKLFVEEWAGCVFKGMLTSHTHTLRSVFTQPLHEKKILQKLVQKTETPFQLFICDSDF